jgi:urea transport system permease protein
VVLPGGRRARVRGRVRRGYFVELLLIRYLYNRPLDTLLSTWGLSLIIQQALRSSFGARETTATLPAWLMGSWQPSEGVDIPLNGLFLLGLSVVMTLGVYLLMYRSRWGLRVRATTMNRAMAGAAGINTKRTDRMTFALGCGIAGVAGAAFTTSARCPRRPADCIVDTFIVVVFGGAASLIGTIISAFSIAQAQSISEFFLTGVLAKVFVLLAVIVLLMIRPKGLIAAKVRE